jgi:hypothetical protein
MGFVEAVIRALIYLCCIALAFFLILWVLGSIGVVLPIMVIQILKVMFALIAILVLIRLFWPMAAGYQWFGPRRPGP